MSIVTAALPAGALRTTYGGLAAVELDPAHARATALLVPGLTGSKEDFFPAFAALAAAGLRVVAVDLPGQYESAGPSEPAGYAVAALGRSLLAVIDDLGGPVHLVGHSVGGLVSRSAVLARPTAVLDLVLLCSGPSALGGGRAEILHLMKPLVQDGGTRAVAEAAAALAAADPQRAEEPAEVRAFLYARHLANNPVGLAAMADAALAEPDLVADLAATGTPVLVVHG
ncbi:MAG: Alpha/beta hydrolase, partial [Frankiales bacterium]|nr:Alpha/beta hydrolase [Frankiales bacterium]